LICWTEKGVDESDERARSEGGTNEENEVGAKGNNEQRIGEEVGDCFWTTRGVKQRCPLNPLLFNILLTDLEEQMRRVK